MPDQYRQDAALEGGIVSMVPATMISRVVDTADIGFGLPVKQGATDKAVAEGIGEGDFLGVTVYEHGRSTFAKDSMARIMASGSVWVKAAVQVAAGDTPSYSAAGWGKATGSGNTLLLNARYDTSGAKDALVQLRLWGTEALAGS